MAEAAEVPLLAIEAGEEAETAFQGESALVNAAETTGRSGNGVEGLNELIKGTPGSAWNSAYKMIDASTGGALGGAESAMNWVGNTLEPALGLESLDAALGDVERYLGFADAESNALIPYAEAGQELVPATENSAGKIDSFFNEIANNYQGERTRGYGNWRENFERWAREWLKGKARQGANWGKRKATGILKSGAQRAKRYLISTAQQMLQERQQAMGQQNLIENKPGTSNKRARTGHAALNLTHPRTGRNTRYRLHKYFLGKKHTTNYKRFI